MGYGYAAASGLVANGRGIAAPQLIGWRAIPRLRTPVTDPLAHNSHEPGAGGVARLPGRLRKETRMSSIFYIIGVIVVVIFVLKMLGLY